MRKRYVLILLCCLALAFAKPASAQKTSLGQFEGHGDVGAATKPGSAHYFRETAQYLITGAGYNIWGDHDEFHFVYRKIKGDFILSARAELVGFGVEMHRKVGWMVRQSLDGRSAHINAVEHGDGLTSLQFRRTTGAITEEKKAAITHADRIELERKGNTYIMRVSKKGGETTTEELEGLDLGDEVYVGLFVGSHNNKVLETGLFSEVSIKSK